MIRIRILDGQAKEVETVRIGDRLTFRIEIPDKTPYGIFARYVVRAQRRTDTIVYIEGEFLKLNIGLLL